MRLLSEIDRIARLRPLLVAVDFDGTVAPIVAHPELARPDDRILTALLELAQAPGVTAAVVSGRRREELESLLGDSEGLILVGEHGSDTGEEVASPPPLDRTVASLESIASDFPGAWVEAKRWSAVFHYRGADPERAPEAVRRVLEGPGAAPGVTALEGHMIVELHLTEVNKGDAVRRLRDSTGAAAVLFIGDDFSDESVFETLEEGDVGVKVGPGETAAGLRVDHVNGVASALDYLAERVG